jgi:hypothetical protein
LAFLSLYYSLKQIQRRDKMLVYLLLACNNDGKISGVVVDWLTNRGINGATVTLYQGDEPENTTTDALGGFYFEKLPTNEGLLIAEAQNYRFAEMQVGVDDMPLIANSEEFVIEQNDLSLTTIRLIPTNQSIEGTIKYNGAAFENANVSVFCNQELLGEAASDATGTYSVSALSLCIEDGGSTTDADGNTMETGEALIPYVVKAQIDSDADGIYDLSQEKEILTGAGQVSNGNFEFTGTVEISETRTLSGIVFVQDWVPAPNALVFLHEDNYYQEQGSDLTDATESKVFAEVLTDANGRFEFTINKDLGQSYRLYGMPYDIDGDGWVDTSIGEVYVEWEEILDNHIITLPESSHDQPKSNCEWASTSYYTLSADEPVYFLFNGSVRQDQFTYSLLGPDDQVIPSTAAWVGNFMVQITPDTPLNSSNPNDIYSVKINSLVYSDGYVSIDPTDSGDNSTCTFRVGELPAFLSDATPSLYEISEFDSEEELVYDTDGNLDSVSSLSNVELNWAHINGTEEYHIYGKQSNSLNGVPSEWELLANVSSSYRVNQQLHTSINLTGFNGGLGPELGMNNTVTVVIKSVDVHGNVSEITGSEPSLVFSDEKSASLESFSHSGTWYYYTNSNRKLLYDPSFQFSENMNVNILPDYLEVLPMGGRLLALEFGSSVYWGSETPTNYSDTAYADSLIIDLLHGSTHTLASNLPIDPDNPYQWELSSSVLAGPHSGWAKGQNIAVYRPVVDDNVNISQNIYYLDIEDISISDNVMIIDPNVSNPYSTDNIDNAYSNYWFEVKNYCEDIDYECRGAYQEFASLNHCWYYFSGYDQPSATIDCANPATVNTSCEHPVAVGYWDEIDYTLPTISAPVQQHPYSPRVGSWSDEINDTLYCRMNKMNNLDDEEDTNGNSLMQDEDGTTYVYNLITGGYVDGSGNSFPGGTMYPVPTSASANTYCPQAGGSSAICKNDLRTSDIIFDPCDSAADILTEAIDGTSVLAVDDATHFFVGQSVVVGQTTNTTSNTYTIESVDKQLNQITLEDELNETLEIGSNVRDSNCSTSFRNSVITTLNSSNDNLITVTPIDASSTTFHFKLGSVSLNGVLVNDILLVEDQGNRAMAQITDIRTIDASFDTLVSTNGSDDIVEITVAAFEPLEQTTLPFDVDPSSASFKVLGDALHFPSTNIQDTSGNVGVDSDRGDIVILNGSIYGSSIQDF